MRIVITGVPGTGKTEIARVLAKQLGYPIIEINKVIEDRKLWRVKDKFGARIALMAPLEKVLCEEMEKQKDVIVEGHLACEFNLPADFVVVCRTDPDILEKRLAERNYPNEKLEENIFAEMLDYCSVYVGQHYSSKNIIELDTTNKSSEESAAEILEALKGAKPTKSNIDWSEKLMKRIGSQTNRNAR